jgi:hypothetical protein
MPGRLLTTASHLMCPHGGQAVLMTSNTRVSADRSQVLLETDVHIVSGCPLTRGNTPSPCLRIEWSSGAGKASINGAAPLVETSIGQCLSAEGVFQGLAVVVNTQQKALAQ